MPKAAPLHPLWERLRVALRDNDTAARDEIEKAMKTERLDPGMKIALEAQMTMAKGKFADAKTRLDNAARMRKLAPPELLIVAHVAIESGDIARAAKLFEDLKAAGGIEDPRYPAGLAAVALAEGKPIEAIAHAKKALAIDPKHWHARYLVGVASGAHGDLRTARSELEAVHKAHPDFLPAWLAWTAFSLDAKKSAEAAKALAPVAERHPDSAELHMALADCRRASGDIEGALAVLGPLASRTKDVGFVLDYAEMALDLRRDVVAEEALRTALTIAPKLSRVHVVIGRLAELQGDHDTAAEAYRRAIVLDPQDIRARNGLGLLLTQDTPLKDWAAAAAELTLACGLADPPPLAPLLNLAILRASEGDKVAAAELAQQILARRPKDPGVLEQARRVADWAKAP
jgi:tetratricopeptide (TPR) repeat protein